MLIYLSIHRSIYLCIYLYYELRSMDTLRREQRILKKTTTGRGCKFYTYIHYLSIYPSIYLSMYLSIL